MLLLMLMLIRYTFAWTLTMSHTGWTLRRFAKYQHRTLGQVGGADDAFWAPIRTIFRCSESLGTCLYTVSSCLSQFFDPSGMFGVFCRFTWGGVKEGLLSQASQCSRIEEKLSSQLQALQVPPLNGGEFNSFASLVLNTCQLLKVSRSWSENS